MPGRTDTRGFTLLETLAVLVVVSIAAGLVVARLPHATTLRLHFAPSAGVAIGDSGRMKATVPVGVTVRPPAVSADL